MGQFNFAILFKVGIVSMLNEPFLQDTSLLFGKVLFLYTAFLACLIHRNTAIFLLFVKRMSILSYKTIWTPNR